MINNNKMLVKVVLLSGLILGSGGAFAGKDLVPGVIDPCEQLWLVNDPYNPYEDPNSDTRPADGKTVAGECIDIPVNLDEVKVLFNLDAPVLNSADNNSPVGLKHMYMLGTVMQHRIRSGEMAADDVAIVGIMHGAAMRAKWAFKNIPEGNNPVAGWIEKIFSLKNGTNCQPGMSCPKINIQLEACGVTLKGMQLKGVKLGNGLPIDEKAMYSSANGKVYLNQGAIGRMIELQQHDFVYLQEE